jgi:hypothetical protein
VQSILVVHLPLLWMGSTIQSLACQWLSLHHIHVNKKLLHRFIFLFFLQCGVGHPFFAHQSAF